MINIPEGWELTTLGDIAELVGGGTPSRTHPEYFLGDYVWLTPTEIPRNRVTVVNDSKEKITEEGLKKSSARLLPKDTVLMTSRASIGYVAIAGIEVSTNQGFASFICKEDIKIKYLAYWLLRSKDFFNNQATGTTFKEITKSKLRNFSFPLAPLPEQERIVAKIETLFTQLEAGTAALKRARAGLKRYKASVLKAAVEGMLFEDGKDLKRTEDGLPDGWRWVKWGDLFSLAQNGFGKRHSDSGTPTIVLRLANIVDRVISYLDVRRIGATEDEIKKYQLVENDMICVRVNGSLDNVGRMILFRNTNERVTFCDHFIRYRLIEPEMAPFFVMYFDTDRARKFIEYNRVSSAGQNTISQGTLQNFNVPLPPLDEQKKIVAEVERRLSVTAATESVLMAAEKRAERLRQSVLKSAFEGRLEKKYAQNH